MSLDQLVALHAEFVRHCTDRDRLGRRLMAAGLPAWKTTRDDAFVYQALQMAIDQAEAEAHYARASA